ncbi:nickel pincer cofactor biosynthesis protein LarC [Salinifilum aidingensis]
MLLWLNPTTGVSGDMLLGALLGLGARLDAVRAAIASTGLPGWQLEHTTAEVGGFLADRAAVHLGEAGHVGEDGNVREVGTARTAAELVELVRRARPEPVADLAARAVSELGRAEAHLHGRPFDEVHLHEVGGADTVVDAVGVAAAVHDLGVTAVHSAPIALGTGTVECEHGVLPAPAPATTRLLRQAAVVGTDLPGETVTPTGAALLAAMEADYRPPPAMTLRATAYGAGSRRFAQRPNMLQASLAAPLRGTPEPPGGAVPHTPSAQRTPSPAVAAHEGPCAAGAPAAAAQHATAAESGSEPMVLLECTVDDVTGETLGHVLQRSLDHGAADAWVTPAVMKKTRPGHVLHVLCAPEHEDALGELVLAETGSLGMRRVPVQRRAAPREVVTVTLEGHPVRVKRGPWQAKPEHSDLVTAAGALGLPVRTAARRAMAQFEAEHGGDDG